MYITDLDFSKPIYTKLEDGIHQVKFNRAELILVRGRIDVNVAVIDGQIAGKGEIAKTRSYCFSNDLDGLVRDTADCEFVRGCFPSYGWFDLTTATHITVAVCKKLLENAPFGFFIQGNVIKRWLWNGTEAIALPYYNKYVPGISDCNYGLRYDLLKRQFILPESVPCSAEKICIGGEWVHPKWYDTKEECQGNNAIKVFTFGD